jgi:hypothetical protein
MASTIKVDNVQNQPGTDIIKKCGSTVTVGAPGNNVTVAGNDVRSNDYKAADGGNIINQCGTTVTLGASGDTINLASGASQSGFGRTGTVDWQTGSIKTTTFTAANGEGYFANTSGGAFTMNLPAGVVGNIVSVVDYTNTFQTYNLTIAPDGSDKIGGIADDVSLNTEGQSVTFVYVDATEGWKNIQDSTSNVIGVAYITATVSGTCNTLATAPCCANVKIATFKNPGTFCVSAVAPAAPDNVVSYMVIGGGGGGGGGTTPDGSSGGGAGGFREDSSPVAPYTASPLEGAGAITVSVQGYPIAVGGGGTGGSPGGASPGVNGTQGVNSTFDSITSAGGGAGHGHNNANSPDGEGGSGAGASGGSPRSGQAGDTPPTTPAQGTPGGSAGSGSGGSSGGGGGASAAGGAGTPGGSGPGGAGIATSITGSPVLRAGGGGGAGAPPRGTPCGGAGPGGGGAAPAGNGTDNTGGGAGGGSGADGGTGGSGLVIIRYKFQ